MNIICRGLFVSMLWVGSGFAIAGVLGNFDTRQRGASLREAPDPPIPSRLTQEDYPHAFPRDGSSKIFENNRVIVWDATWLNDVAQPYHRHRYDLTGVFLRWGPLKVTRLDGTFSASQNPFEVPWVFFQPKGVTHKEEGIGPPERHAVMIDIKDYTGAPPEAIPDLPEAFPRAGTEEVLDRPRVTVWDVNSSTGWAAPLHVHPRDTVAVFLEGGTIRMRQTDGTEESISHAYKDLIFIPAGTTHSSSVTSGAPRAMFYELRN